jgi:tetratricopeptide (TPR) repeat protein
VETLGLLASAFTTLGQTPKAISVFREIARVHADAGEAQDEANALRGLLALDPTDASAQKKLKSLVEASAPTTLDDDDAELLSEEDDDLLMVDDDAASSPPRPSSPPPVELERQALIARLLAECEVFVRYGLRDKIIAQLGRVLELDPNHVEAREKLKEAHVKRGEIAQAVSQLLRLSEIVGADAVSARAYMAEAAALQPDNESIATKLTALKAAAAAQEAEEDEVVFVDETEADRDAEGVPVSGASEVRVQRFSSIPPASSPVSAISEDDDEPEMMLEDGAEDDPIEAEDANSAADSEAIDANEAAATSEELPEAVVEALEEVDFYLAQKLVDEAREALNDALLEHPDHAALLAKLASLDADPSGATETSAAQQAVAPPLATAEAKGAERTAKLAAETATGKQGPLGVEQALQQFREGVRRQVDNSDTATHYDLGIAYMGMGLHAEAIEAFTLCLENPEKRHTAHTMIGLSHVAKGDMSTGISHFKQALVSPQCTPEDEVGLWFEIGNASELSGKASEALIWYEKVEEQNPAFRDVSARIERLGMIKTPQQEGDDFDEMFDSMIIKD